MSTVSVSRDYGRKDLSIDCRSNDEQIPLVPLDEFYEKAKPEVLQLR